MGRRTCYYLGQQLTTENGAALPAVQSALFQCKSTGATSHHDRRTGLGCPAFDPRVQCTGSTGLTLKNNPSEKTLLECWTAISMWYEKTEPNPANFKICFNLIISMFNVGVGQSKWTKLFDQEKLTICQNKFGFNNSKLNILHPVVSQSRGYLESLQSIKLVMWISA